MKKLLFLVAEDGYFCSHRLNLGKAALKAGFEVALATRCKHHLKDIQDAGIQVFPLMHFSRGSLNPITQLQSIFELIKIYKTFKPDIVHHVAMKPVLLGSLVARWCRVPKIINALGGLGYLFTGDNNLKKTILRTIICRLFKFIFSRPSSILILQNQDDLQTLSNLNCVPPNQVVIIPGAGVDINQYPETPFPPEPPVIVTCISRMLWSKGIGELVDAAKILQEKKILVEVNLYGAPDMENPDSIPEAQLQAWHNSQIIQWKGETDNTALAYSQCHIAVLPSYREGLPKSLLEAASCGRPIVTTDVPGCRSVVVDGENGLLVPAKDSQTLAKALETLIQNQTLRAQMGKLGRERVEKFFRDDLIHEQTLKLYA